MLLGRDLDAYSSFGPSGRSKVVENLLGGSLIVTKDGQQIIDCYLSDPRCQDILQKKLIEMCCSVSKKHGDGSLAAVVIMSYAIRELNKYSLERSSPSTQRILLLRAVEIVFSSAELLKLHICQHMISCSVWQLTAQDESDHSVISRYVRGLWGSILQPATNSITALNIGNILVSHN